MHHSCNIRSSERLSQFIICSGDELIVIFYTNKPIVLNNNTRNSLLFFILLAMNTWSDFENYVKV